MHDVRGASEEQFDVLGGTGKSALLSLYIANNGGVEEQNRFVGDVSLLGRVDGVGGVMWGSKAVHQHHS